MRALRRFVFAVALVAPLALITAPREAEAKIRVGPHVGYSTDIEEVFVGADLWFGLVGIGDLVQLNLNPEFSYYFLPENTSLWSIDLNAPFLFGIPGLDLLSPYVGPGLTIRHATANADAGVFGDLSASDTDIGFNIVGGAIFMPDGFVNPFAGIEASLADRSDFSVLGGVLVSF